MTQLLSPLHLTDRSRFVLGTGHCETHRYFRYHHQQTGIVPKNEPLAPIVGTAIHSILTTLIDRFSKGLHPLQDRSPQGVREFTRDVIHRYVGHFREALKTNQVSIQDRKDTDVHEEQACLVEGCAWAWYKTWLQPTAELPSGEYLHKFSVLRVEDESSVKLGKDSGVKLMYRPDIVVGDATHYEVHDIKTGARESVDAWNHDLQMALYLAALHPLTFAGLYHLTPGGNNIYRILLINKGSIRPDYNPSTRAYDLPKTQQSILCYIHAKPGIVGSNPNWMIRRLGSAPPKGFLRTPIWECDFTGPSEATQVERWVMDHAPAQEIADLVPILGPYSPTNDYIKRVVKSVLVEEGDWVRRLSQIAHGLGTPEEVVPKSWRCNSYYGEPCPYKTFCIEGTQDSPHFRPRVPHHDEERRMLKHVQAGAYRTGHKGAVVPVPRTGGTDRGAPPDGRERPGKPGGQESVPVLDSEAPGP